MGVTEVGRTKAYRQNLNAYVKSVREKTVHCWLLKQTQGRFGVALQEAILLADKAATYLSDVQGVNLGHQFWMDLYPVEPIHSSSDHSNAYCCPVRLTAFSHDELDILVTGGLRAMQNNRIFRLLEEAAYQGACLSYQQLCMLTTITAKSIRERLIPLWAEGIRLPVRGTDKRHRVSGRLRPAHAIEQHLAGTSVEKLKTTLCFSDQQWKTWVSQFLSICMDRHQIDLMGGTPKLLADEYRRLYASVQGTTALRDFSDSFLFLVPNSTTKRKSHGDLFDQELAINHGFSPAKRTLYLQMLSDVEKFLQNLSIPANSIVYFATSDSQKPGQPLEECDLKPAVITWWDHDDLSCTDKDSTASLKWRKMCRFSSMASNCATYLTQYDLAFLLAVHPGVIQKAIKEHPNVLLPLRGNMVDIGPGVSHAEKIISLYLQGYTETQIVYRTGHTYSSIENYLLAFSKVVAMIDRGLPLPLIRQTIGCSLHLVEKHAELYERFNTPDYQFSLMQIRRAFDKHSSPESKKKRQKRGGPYGTVKKKESPLRFSGRKRPCLFTAERSCFAL